MLGCFAVFCRRGKMRTRGNVPGMVYGWYHIVDGHVSASLRHSVARHKCDQIHRHNITTPHQIPLTATSQWKQIESVKTKNRVITPLGDHYYDMIDLHLGENTIFLQ